MAIPTPNTRLSEGEITCSVHLSATIKSFTRKSGGAVLVVREIQDNTNPVVFYCTCRLAAEFHINNVGLDRDEPFPMFSQLD